MSWKPVRYDVYAIALLSGDQAGVMSSARVTVTRFWLAPS